MVASKDVIATISTEATQEASLEAMLDKVRCTYRTAQCVARTGLHTHNAAAQRLGSGWSSAPATLTSPCTAQRQRIGNDDDGMLHGVCVCRDVSR